MQENFHRKKHLTSFQMIILGFAGVILLGTLLLMLPVSSADGIVTPFDEALFTSTSAVCVTGLVVQDTGSYWSGFGQTVILILIQTGGLGVVTVAVAAFMLSGRNKKGDSTTTFVSAGIYGRDEITDKETQETSYIYYVDKNKFKEGDALVEPDSGEKFIIGDTEVLEGVFCVNQGYAVFRRIEILDENEEYAVVSKETYNGLVRYDRIVKNADKVSEQDILY